MYRVLTGALILFLGSLYVWALAPGNQEALVSLLDLIKRGDYQEAETQARQHLEVASKTYGPDSLEAAKTIDIIVQAMWRGGKAGDEETLALAETSLEIKQARLGAANVEVGHSLNELGNVLTLRAEYDRAEESFLRALDVYRESLGSDHSDVGKVLNNLGSLYRRTSKYDKAEDYSRQALELYQRLSGPQSLDVADAAENLGVALASGGKAGSLPLWEQALGIRLQLLGENHPAVANTLSNLGYGHMEAGNYEQAEKYMLRSLETRRETLGASHPEIAQSLANLAILDSMLGRPAVAAKRIRQAIQIFEETLGLDHPDVAISYATLAIMESDEGNYQESRNLHEKAVRIFLTSLGADHKRVAWVRSNLGSLLLRTGDYAAAKIQLVEAERILKRFAEDSIASAVYSNLAVVYEARDDFSNARLYFEKAIAIDSFSPGLSASMGQKARFAQFLLRRGDLVEARSLLEEASPGFKTFQAKGQLTVAEGRPDLAIDWYRKALEFQLDHFGPAHPDIVETRLGLAEAFFLAGRTEEALDSALEAEDLSRRLLRLTAQGLSEREALRFAENRRSGLDLAISCAVLAPSLDATERVWDAVIRSRALTLDEMSTRMRLMGTSQDPDTSQIVNRLSELRSQLAHLSMKDAGDVPKRYSELLEEVRGEKEKLERRLGQRSSEFRSWQKRASAGFRDVVGGLPPDSALIAFVKYHTYGEKVPAFTKLAEKDAPASYAALVLTSGLDGRPELVPLGEVTRIDTSVAEWRSQILSEPRSPNQDERFEADYRSVGERLRKEIWDPLADYVRTAKVVLLVPEGPLHLVNFAALPTGADRYLIEDGPTFSYLSAERDLADVVAAEPSGNRLLVFAAPAFDKLSSGQNESFRGTTPSMHPAEAACHSFDSLEFGPLRAALEEGNAVRSIWSIETTARSSETQSQVTLLTGGEASEAAFRRLSPEYTHIHLATHGFVLSGKCTTFGLGTATRGVGKVSFPKRPKPISELGDNPMLLSGLALAGANQRSTGFSGEDDGILTAEEISGLNLSKVKVAVLSACDTGLGTVQAGEGVLGLRRAFRIAGVRSLVFSLWPVQDRLASKWASSFYQNYLEQDDGVAGAARRTSLGLLKERRRQGLSTHPAFWASFIPGAG